MADAGVPVPKAGTEQAPAPAEPPADGRDGNTGPGAMTGNGGTVIPPEILEIKNPAADALEVTTLRTEVEALINDARDEVDGCDLDYGRRNPNFIDWRKNREIALLMVMQKFFTEMNTMGRIRSWQAMWQLKQLFKVGVLEEQHCVLHMGLQSLHGDYTAYLDDNTFKAVYKPRGTYQGDFGELVRFLTRRYLSSHDFEGESMYKEMLEFLRDLDLDDSEQRQLQIDRNNDSSGPALEEM